MLTRVKVQILTQHPFLASAMLKMDYVEDASVKTACISKRVIKYNPDWVRSLSTKQQMGLLAHELMHHLFLHDIRGVGKEHRRWNEACDYAINPILKNNGFELPDGGLLNWAWENKSAEEIYKILEKENQDDSDDGGGDDGSDGQKGQGTSISEIQDHLRNNPQDWGQVEQVDSNESLSELEAQAKQDLTEAMNIAKQAGQMPGNIQRLIDDVIEPKKDWRQLLLKYIAERAYNDYSWSAPNRRYVYSGIYLPELKSLELGDVVFAIDTSISVDEEQLSLFVAEIKEASELFNFPVTVIHCDSKVQHVEELEYDSIIEPKGGGGTKFVPVFDWVNENKPDVKALVYFTDGGASDLGKLQEPEYDVLWIIYNNPYFKIDFGEVINLDKHDLQ